MGVDVSVGVGAVAATVLVAVGVGVGVDTGTTTSASRFSLSYVTSATLRISCRAIGEFTLTCNRRIALS